MAFEYLSQYQSFDSVGGMDEAVEKHVNHHYYDLTESERAIVYTLSKRSLLYPGASHLKADTIANALEISTKTVYRSVKKLVEFRIVEKVQQTKLNGIKGASIYKILPFDIKCPNDMSERMTADEPCYDEVSETFTENQSLSFNLLKSFKTCNTNIINLQNELALQDEKKTTFMNEYQVMLYDFLHSLPMQDSIKDELHKLVLATDLNDAGAFYIAKNVFVNMLLDINNGTLTVSNTLRATFAGAYQRASKREVVPASTTTIVENHKSVPIYNWLNERENYVTTNINKPSIENWLEW